VNFRGFVKPDGDPILQMEDSLDHTNDNWRFVLDHAKVPIVTAATVYYDEQSKNVYCLVFHEVFWFGDTMKTALLTPNQLRANQVEVLDISLQYGGTSHSLYIAAHNLRIPLTLQGIMSGFSSRKPTLEEYMNTPKVVMARDFLWDPNSDTHAEAESMMTADTATVNYVPDPLHFELDDTVCHILL
jgi:isochorismate hydrolase